MGTENKSTNRALCFECVSLQEYEIRSIRETRTIAGKDYTFNKRIGVCKCCGNQITVPGLDDENEVAFERIYRGENGYIQIDEIEKILEKYDVEKRPLSKLLGMGEHTIEKYLEGQLPNKNYSDRLLRVLSNYLCLIPYFEENKSKLTPKAIEKIQKKINYYDSITSYHSQVELIALYILNSKYEITNMALQKLLYYIEAFAQVLLHEQIFESRCEAWMYGPVYPEIYDKYKCFSGNQIIIDKQDLSDKIDKRYVDLIDYVLENYAIYNGVTLKELSHAEEPWLDAHKGYADNERCEEEITHESISEYFDKINKKFDLSKTDGVKEYIASLGIM